LIENAFHDLGFNTAFACRATLRVNAPSADATPPTPVRLADLLLVEVATHGGSEWRHEFGGLARNYPLAGAFGCPSPEQVCVIVQGLGWMVPVRRPEHSEPIPGAPLIGIRRVPGRDLLLVWGVSDLMLYGTGGRVWRIERLSEDDLEVLDLTPERITGTVWVASSGPEPYVSGRRAAFEVEIDTGRVRGGWIEPNVIVG
jgi:hypothetical protein